MPDSTEFTHPTSPSFGDTAFTPVPRLTPGKTQDVYLGELDKYLADQFVSIMDMQASITQGWIVDGLRVINLTAQNITSETIFTQDLYIGEDSQLELSGTTDQLLVRDDNGTVRVTIGNLGSGATEWGIKIADSTGTVKFQSSSATFIDGAMINNATITDSKIVGMDGEKLDDGSVNNTQIGSMSASKITVSGTLTCSSTATAIDVTSGGVVLLRNGADIIMRASAAGETSYLSFRTSTDSARGNVSYDVASNEFRVKSVFGADLRISSSTSANIYVASADQIDIRSGTNASIVMGSNITLTPDTVVVIDGNLRSAAHNTDNFGSDAIRWKDGFFVDIHSSGGFTTGDINFGEGKGLVITEPDRVYLDGHVEEGVYFMRPDTWEPVAYLTKQGSLLISGRIEQDWVFPKPSIPRRNHESIRE